MSALVALPNGEFIRPEVVSAIRLGPDFVHIECLGSAFVRIDAAQPGPTPREIAAAIAADLSKASE